MLCSPGFEFCMMPNIFAYLVLVYQTSFQACPAKVDKIKSTTLNNYCGKLSSTPIINFTEVRADSKSS